jgi:uncharacterized protein
VSDGVSRRPSLWRLASGVIAAAVAFAGLSLSAAEKIPPAPARYFNDFAGIASSQASGELNSLLESYEKESSNQLLVAVFPKMESDSSVEDYTVRVAQAWKVGQKGRNNGAVLFAFMQEHKLYIQVGYGLEPVLTDATCRRIIEEELKPAFRAGDYDRGLRGAVKAMIAATKGEYKGTGRTVAGALGAIPSKVLVWTVLIVLWIVFSFIRRFQQPVVYGGRRHSGLSSIFWTGGGGGWSSGGGSSGGESGGGGFSGGGGSFGGGGAGGSW